MRMAAQLPGRKIVFMVSDGFYLNDRKSGSMSRIKRITDAAGRAGVVINTLDARGIISEMLSADNPSPVAEGASMNIGEVMASQDGLNALAGDTGGRAFRNTNAPMAEFVDKVLDETANYYLLAWRPDSDERKARQVQSYRSLDNWQAGVDGSSPHYLLQDGTLADTVVKEKVGQGS